MDDETLGAALGFVLNIFTNFVVALIVGGLDGPQAAILAAAIGGAYSAWQTADAWLKRCGR